MQPTKGTWHICEWCVLGSLSFSPIHKSLGTRLMYHQLFLQMYTFLQLHMPKMALRVLWRKAYSKVFWVIKHLKFLYQRIFFVQCVVINMRVLLEPKIYRWTSTVTKYMQRNTYTMIICGSEHYKWQFRDWMVLSGISVFHGSNVH